MAQEGKKLKNNLSQILTQKGIRQSTLAVKTGLSPNYISLIISGKRTPTLLTAHKIAQALGYTIDEIFFSTYSTKDSSPKLKDEKKVTNHVLNMLLPVSNRLRQILEYLKEDMGQ